MAECTALEFFSRPDGDWSKWLAPHGRSLHILKQASCLSQVCCYRTLIFVFDGPERSVTVIKRGNSVTYWVRRVLPLLDRSRQRSHSLFAISGTMFIRWSKYFHIYLINNNITDFSRLILNRRRLKRNSELGKLNRHCLIFFKLTV